jgi:cytochrome b561
MIEASSAGRHRFPARLLHWAVALVLPIQFLLGWLSEGVPGQQAGFFLLRLHYQLGMLLVLLMVLRLAWCLARGTRGVRVHGGWARVHGIGAWWSACMVRCMR